MGICLKILFATLMLSAGLPGGSIYAQPAQQDTVNVESRIAGKQEHFYDSLKSRANNGKITKLLYDFLITSPRLYVDKKALTLAYFKQMEGKIISEIIIKPLDVFGPSVNDTSRVTKNWVGKTANALHTKSNLKTIRKLLFFKLGDPVDPELLYENERVMRSLPYIKEVRFILEQDSIYSGLVKVHIITKDRFSFGVSGYVDGVESAAFEVYNQNVFGRGHELSVGFVGHVDKQPYLGLETYYKIKNISGKFVDFSVGYLNTYRDEGFRLILNKPFITSSVKWGYGASAFRMFRSFRVSESDPVQVDEPLNVLYSHFWAGRNYQIRKDGDDRSQITLSGGFVGRDYYSRPNTGSGYSHYFSKSTFLLSGVTFSQRRYVQDQLVYSYGITEDIPEGFKNELVYGYDFNEFGNRHYAHISLSNGNLLINRKGYLYLAGNFGGYFGKSGFEQGQIDASLYFISRQINAGNKRARFFTRAEYTLGINRFDLENVNLSREDAIRGFRSRQAIGKQRLSLDLEYVLFLRKEFYKFNMAFFAFTDIGIIGSNKKLIFTQDYYSGIGAGMRLHNENLVFKTLQLRLAFYPFHPDDMSFVGFVLEEQSKRQFYSFEPSAPLPFIFR